MKMKKISLCITNYNRNALLFKSFEQVINDDRISEICIWDDFSDSTLYSALLERVKYMPKVRITRSEMNKGVYEAKFMAVQMASNEYCIIFDSDNVIDVSYIDKLYSVNWFDKQILAPDFAYPTFDYRNFAGTTYNKTNVAPFAFRPGFDCLMNTMNFFVHKYSYLAVWQKKDGIKGADSIYFNYLWLMAGNEIHVLKGLEYFHRVEGHGTEARSNFVNHAAESTPICKEIERQISLMR